MRKTIAFALLAAGLAIGQTTKSVAPGAYLTDISDDFILRSAQAGYNTIWVSPNYALYTAEFTNGLHNHQVSSKLVQDYLNFMLRVNSLSNGTLKVYPKISGQSRWDHINTVNSKVLMATIKDLDIKDAATMSLVHSITGCSDAYGYDSVNGWACYVLKPGGEAVAVGLHVVGVWVDKAVTGLMRFFGFKANRTLVWTPRENVIETLVKSTNNPEADKTWQSVLESICIAYEQFQKQTGISYPIKSVDLGGDEPYTYGVISYAPIKRIADYGYSNTTDWMNALLAEYDKKIGIIDAVAKNHTLLTSAKLFIYADAIDPMVGQKHFSGKPDMSKLKSKSRIVFRPWNYQKMRSGLDFASLFGNAYQTEEIQIQITHNVWQYDTKAVVSFFEQAGVNYAFTWAYPDEAPEQTRMLALSDWIAISTYPHCIGYNLYTDAWPHSNKSIALLSSAYAAREIAPSVLTPNLLR